MRITFLTHYFPPEVGAPQARISALARGLAAQGHAATVHTCPPHYPDGVIRLPYRNRLFADEVHDGVRVVRSTVYPAPNVGVVRRLANHASFALSAVATAPIAGPADVVLAETPPLFTAAAGAAYAAVKRAALVLNVADRWPESAIQLGALSDRRAIRAAEALELFCYRRAVAMTVPTAGLAAALDALPEAQGRVHHVPPAVDLDRFASVPLPEAERDGPLRVLYAGTVGLAQGVGTLVEAARLAGPSTVDVTIAGSGAELEAIERRLAGERSPNVRLAGVVERDRVPALFEECDAAVVLLRARPIFEGAVPTKILEAMAAGRPVLLSASGEAAQLVEEARAGVVVPPEDPAALASAFRELAAVRGRLRELGEAGRRHARERFGRERSLERWAAVLDGAAQGPPLSRRTRRPRAS